MKLSIVLLGLVATAASMPASTILFRGLGSLTSSQAFGPVTATGYTSNSVTGLLYSKGAASTRSEDGLGCSLIRLATMKFMPNWAMDPQRVISFS